MDATPFQSLNTQEKITFFLKGQELLMNYHPDSEFIFRENNMTDRIKYVKDLVSKYQGLIHQEENILILFNKIVVADVNNPVAALADNMFKPPHPNYNAISIDFVIFRKLEDCLNFVRSQYDAKIQHVVYVKNGKPQIFKPEKFISKLFHIPLSVPRFG